jgi:hypothetical protein
MTGKLVSTVKVSLYEIGTCVGLPPLEGTGLATGVAMVYSNLEHSISAVTQLQDPAELVPELLGGHGPLVLFLSPTLAARAVVEVGHDGMQDVKRRRREGLARGIALAFANGNLHHSHHHPPIHPHEPGSVRRGLH